MSLCLTPGECRGSFAAPGSSICSLLCQYIERIGPHSGDPPPHSRHLVFNGLLHIQNCTPSSSKSKGLQMLEIRYKSREYWNVAGQAALARRETGLMFPVYGPQWCVWKVVDLKYWSCFSLCRCSSTCPMFPALSGFSPGSGLPLPEETSLGIHPAHPPSITSSSSTLCSHGVARHGDRPFGPHVHGPASSHLGCSVVPPCL